MMMMMFYRTSILISTLLVGILSSETAFASCQGGIAQDDPTFKYTSKSGVKRSCKNISRKPKRIRRMCRLPEVQSHCMLTCGGSCCVDDDIFEFPMIWGDNQQRCEFITKNTKQLWKRRQTYCEGNGNGNGATETDSEKIRSMCPNACNLTCDETGKPVLVPTTSPPPPNNPKPPTNNNNNNNNGRPNILQVLADDVGTGDVYTMEKVQMKNLNALMRKRYHIH
uniref:SREBP regulating gene protein n=1 Tax=Chaetoceros debilis TaxID=122233 RepID=A0A7S3VF25_9STRA